MTSNGSECRQNYHQECEEGINKQINLEFSAMYAYTAMAAHFERDDVALPGFRKFFEKSAAEEREHAQKFISFQNDRGGRVELRPLAPPSKQSFQSGLEAMETALALEKSVNQALLDLHAIATTHDDGHMTDFIEGNFLTEQVEAIKQLSDYCTNLRRVGPGLGEYMFDKETLNDE